MDNEIALIYTGAGRGDWLPGIPARDLTAAEVKEYGGLQELLKTGLYEKPKDVVKAKEK